MKVLETGYMAQILLKISELQDNVPKKKRLIVCIKFQIK